MRDDIYGDFILNQTSQSSFFIVFNLVCLDFPLNSAIGNAVSFLSAKEISVIAVCVTQQDRWRISHWNLIFLLEFRRLGVWTGRQFSFYGANIGKISGSA